MFVNDQGEAGYYGVIPFSEYNKIASGLQKAIRNLRIMNKLFDFNIITLSKNHKGGMEI